MTSTSETKGDTKDTKVLLETKSPFCWMENCVETYDGRFLGCFGWRPTRKANGVAIPPDLELGKIHTRPEFPDGWVCAVDPKCLDGGPTSEGRVCECECEYKICGKLRSDCVCQPCPTCIFLLDKHGFDIKINLVADGSDYCSECLGDPCKRCLKVVLECDGSRTERLAPSNGWGLCKSCESDALEDDRLRL